MLVVQARVLSYTCTRDDGELEVDARSPIGEAGSQRTHINAGMRKTARSSRMATAHRLALLYHLELFERS